MTGLWLGGIGLVGADTLRLFLIALPLLLAGTRLGHGFMCASMKPVVERWSRACS